MPTQEEVVIDNNENAHETGRDLTIKYLENDVDILDFFINEYDKLNIEEFGRNPCTM